MAMPAPRTMPEDSSPNINFDLCKGADSASAPFSALGTEYEYPVEDE
jgi:hypothetical protein